MIAPSELSRWFDAGVQCGSTHMIIVCDTFDHDDYPVYCADDADAIKQHAHYTVASMQRIMEVYDLRMDKAAQLAEKRANHLPDIHAIPAPPRANQPDVRNPLLALPGVQEAIATIPLDSRRALKNILLSLRKDAQQKAAKSWRTHKAPMALYWKCVAVYAGHIARLLRSE